MDIPPLPIGREGVAALIPHSGAMCLIDRVVAVGPEEATCTAASHLAPGNPLRANGVLPASAAIEYAAQAMAVHAALVRGGPPRRGFLAVASGVAWSAERMDVGTELIVQVVRLASTGGGAQYSFRVASGAEPGAIFEATGTLTLSLEPEPTPG